MKLEKKNPEVISKFQNVINILFNVLLEDLNLRKMSANQDFSDKKVLKKILFCIESYESPVDISAKTMSLRNLNRGDNYIGLEPGREVSR